MQREGIRCQHSGEAPGRAVAIRRRTPAERRWPVEGVFPLPVSGFAGVINDVFRPSFQRPSFSTLAAVARVTKLMVRSRKDESPGGLDRCYCGTGTPATSHASGCNSAITFELMPCPASAWVSFCARDDVMLPPLWSARTKRNLRERCDGRPTNWALRKEDRGRGEDG